MTANMGSDVSGIRANLTGAQFGFQWPFDGAFARKLVYMLEAILALVALRGGTPHAAFWRNARYGLCVFWLVLAAGYSHAQSQSYVIFESQTNNECVVTGLWSTWAAAGAAGLAGCTSQLGLPNLSISWCTPDPPSGVYGGCEIDSNGMPTTGLELFARLQTVSTKDAGTPPPATPEATTGDPIAVSIGNKIQTVVDYQAPGFNALQFVRYYNSATIASSASHFAQGWMHNYAASINTISSTAVAVTRPDGKAFTFNLVGSTWTPDADVSDKLVQLVSGSTVTGWQYFVAANDSLETYDAYGNLSSIAYREGTLLTLTYATGTGAPTFPAQLLSVTDAFGRKISFGYSNTLISTMTDPNGGVYTYALGTTGLLSSVTYPDMYSESYLYNESAYTSGQNFPYALTGVIDENQSRYSTTWYGSGGAAIQSQLAPGTPGNIGLYTLTNTLDGTGRIQSTSIVDPLGATRGRTFTTTLGRNLVTTVTQPAANGSPAASKSYAYDANGNMDQITDLNGNVQCFVYDLTRNLETGRVEGMAPGSTCPSNIPTYTPASGTVERKTLTQSHSIWHPPAQRAEPLKITTWVFNGDGGVYCAPTTAKVGVNPIGVVCTRTEQATTDATGGAGFSATASGSSRVWAYTYNGFGQVLTVNGPRTDVADVTTYTYYTCTTGAKCGQINTIQDALGHTSTFLTYDGNGNPLTVSDPNGLVTTLIYDARQRVKSRQVGAETTSYTYYPTGLLNLVTLPDGSTVQYTYDAAHRLTQITDGAGNYIKYTLDSAGNRTAENSYDPSAVLHRTHTRVFSAVNMVFQDVNAAGTSGVTTTYGYDAQGNQTSIAAPLTRNTSNTFDALNRLKQITDPKSGITKLSYDGQDNILSVIDPRTFTTSYSPDGFGGVTQLVSPDTGTSHKTFDTAGNLATTTDARGALGTFSYDALNRLTKIVYTDQTINFTYDAGTNGIGRLTGASDANHSMSWSYDTHGRVTGKGQTIGTITKSVGYGFTNDDRTSLTTPSGQSVVYGYTNHRITSISVNGTIILSSATYDPFGPVTGWTWGNSTTVSRAYDQDGSPHQIVTAGVTNGYTVDNATRVTNLSDSGLSSNTWGFGYDALDRLTSGSSSAKNRSYTYDASGNRLTQGGTTSVTLTPSTTSNQLSSTSGGLVRTYGYDASGNTLSYTGDTFTYNKRGRMATSAVGGGTTNYTYNALGQLIEKSGYGGTTLIVYDEAGHILGEYTSTGALIQETVWMDHVPVATLVPSGSSVAIYYIHTDHLYTPRKITRPSDNGLMWRYDPDTFSSSTSTPNNNPSGLGAFNYNLRYPGQYALTESGLFYNYFRTYDPQTGRYLESDPIGLAGGINQYAYAMSNPVSRIDRSGLFSLDFVEPTALLVSELPGTRIGDTRTGTGVTCTCKQCGNSWTLEQCHANVYITVKILSSRPPAQEAFARAAEQQHVDDMRGDRREMETAGWKAEQANQRLPFSDEKSCMEGSAAKVRDAVNAVVLSQEAATRAQYDDTGLHTYPGHH